MKLEEAFKVPGYDQLEIYYEDIFEKEFSIEKNAVKKLESNFTAGVGVRAIVKNKVGFAYTTNFDKLADTVKLAIKIAKFSNQKLKLKKYKKYVRPKNIFDKKLLDVNDKDILYTLKKAIAFTKKKGFSMIGGGIKLVVSFTRYINSEGVDLKEKGSVFAVVSEVARSNINGIWSFDSRQYADNFLEITKKSIDLAKQLSRKRKIKTGRYDVVFHPFALEEIFENGFYSSFSADLVQKGKSFLAGKLNKEIFDKKLTIYDNGVLAGGIGSSAFDGEGTPSQKTLLVKNGVLKNYLYDLTRAQKENKQSTGNAQRGFDTLPHIAPTNFQIMPGKTKDPISQIDKGLLFYLPLNAHSINPITGDFSVGTHMALWIENGEVKFSPKNVMIAGNLFDLLKNIRLIGKEVMQVGDLVSPHIVSQAQVIGD